MIIVLLSTICLLVFIAAACLCFRLFVRRNASPRAPLALNGLAFISASIGIYYIYGAAPELIAQYSTQQQIEQRGGDVVIGEAIAELENKVTDNPQQQLLLAQLYEATGDLAKARALYLTVGTQENNPQALTKYIQMEYALEGALGTQAAKRAEQLFSQEPNNKLVTSLWATHLQQQRQYFAAAKVWHKLLFLAQSEEEHEYVLRALEDTTALLSDSEQAQFAGWQQAQVRIEVTVGLSAAAQAAVRTSDTLFVSVKHPTKAQPLAARRISAAQFPVRLIITEIDLLPPATTFGTLVNIKASISANGRPLGDSVVVAEQSLDLTNNSQPKLDLQLEVTR